MGGEKLRKVGGVDIDHIILAHDPGGGSAVVIRDAEAATLIIDKAVKGDLPFGAKVEKQGRCHLQHLHPIGTAAVMRVLRHSVGGFVVDAVLPVAPVQCRSVQVGNRCV